MATREVDPRLQKLRDDGVEITSISRCNCINGCEYEAYRTYKLGDRGRNNIYGIAGSKVHEVLENITNGLATEADLLPSIQEELDDMDMLGISFPKDFKGEDSIKRGWVADMEHFAKTYKAPPSNNLSTEELFIYTTDKGVTLQGYIDLLRTNEDGSVDIFDYKTSSIGSYQKNPELQEHARQLIIYQLGCEQLGKKVNSVSWLLLKYVDITFMGKKTAKSKEKTLIKKTVERRKIGADMAKYIEQDLFEAGYDEIDSECYLNEFKTTNMFECLPEDIKSKYRVEVCCLPFEVTDENKQECIDYINNTMLYWRDKGEDEAEYSHRPFTKIQKNGKEVDDIFYCTSLCAHFEKCPHIHEYLDSKKEKELDEYEDLF